MKSSNTLSQLILSTESTTSGPVQWSGEPVLSHRRRRVRKSVENAVYAYIRAIRALGRTKISTGEIAEALLLPIEDVNSALSSLKRKGVRTLNG
jgi:hypothetical protein